MEQMKRPTTDTETLNHTRVRLQIVGTNSNDQRSLQYMYTILLPWKQTTYNPANSYGADWNSILLPMRLGWHLAFIVQAHLAFSNPDHIPPTYLDKDSRDWYVGLNGVGPQSRPSITRFSLSLSVWSQVASFFFFSSSSFNDSGPDEGRNVSWHFLSA